MLFFNKLDFFGVIFTFPQISVNVVGVVVLHTF